MRTGPWPPLAAATEPAAAGVGADVDRNPAAAAREAASAALDEVHPTVDAGSKADIRQADIDDPRAAGERAQFERARAFAEPLLAGRLLDTGEDALGHAAGVAAILRAIGAAPSLGAAAYLVYAGDYLSRPDEVIDKAFGPAYAGLVSSTRKLVQIQRAARAAQVATTTGGRQADTPLEQRAQQTERVRKMLLAFSRDLRVVLLRLASRLQTLRHFAASKQPCPAALAAESLQVFAPLANRLGIWQIKWEVEDLAFRFLQPQSYQAIARLLDEKRVERERGIEAFRQRLLELLLHGGISAEVQGRPKHIHGIWKKMHGKRLDFERVLDLRALRIIVAGVGDCYAVLGRVHEAFRPLADQYDDYIARPKANGYQSLHTVVLDDTGRPVEVQIRTAAMHEHAEHGVAAHWAYKEAGVKGYAGVSADGADALATESRKAVLRQLLAWERDFVEQAAAGVDAGGSGGAAERADDGLPVPSVLPALPGAAGGRPRDQAAEARVRGGPAAARAGRLAAPADAAPADDRIYVFTPAATIVELPAGATPVDFAYVVHTDLGHRCRGARVDGAMVPLNTPLANGQTVEISAAKEGGPSLDWLNAELGYLQSPRSRAKVRAWFNALQQAQTVARGREAVERALQRVGRTSIRHDELAAQLGFRNAAALFEVVGKDEFSLRNIENLLRPPAEPAAADEAITLRRPRADHDHAPPGGVLVVGVESLMTALARCCRPAPPDAIGGYVTRGKGVAVHRRGCSNFREMARRTPERVIAVAWGAAPASGRAGNERPAVYPVDVIVEAADRQGLLRDITEVFAKEGMNVSGVNTQSKPVGGGTAWMTFTVEVTDAARLSRVLALVARVGGVRSARRR